MTKRTSTSEAMRLLALAAALAGRAGVRHAWVAGAAVVIETTDGRRLTGDELAGLLAAL